MKPTLTKLISVCLLLLTLLVAVPVGAARISFGTDCIAAGCDMVKSGLCGTDVVFSAADFKQAIGVSEFEAITVVTLPDSAEGLLKLSGARVSAGESIPYDRIADLTFTAATPLVTSASFTFRVDGISVADMHCTVRLVEEYNTAPSVKQVSDARLSVETQKNLSLWGSLSAYDPEGDPLTYLIVSYPEKGTLTLLDAATGDFRYTPKAGYTGKDSFRYVVRDSFGNYSGIATVSVTVGRRASDIEYSDMQESSAYGAALLMQANGIMQGTILGDGLYFLPDMTVSRSDFVVMAMKAAGIPARTSLDKTFFDDDDTLNPAQKGYLATAQRLGYIIGTFRDNRLVFEGDKPITRAEAAVIVARILHTGDTAARTVFTDESSIPVWAENAVYALYDLGLLSRTGSHTIAASEAISRAQTAELLAAVMQYLQ